MSQTIAHNVAWIHGAYHQSHEILTRIKTKYQHAEYYKFNATSNFADLYNTLTSTSCFSACKLIVIHEMMDISDGDKKKLREVLENLDKTNLVVFYLIDPQSEKTLYSLVQKIGKIYAFDDLISTQNLSEHIRDRCKQSGINLDDDALSILMENTQKVQNGKFFHADTIECALKRLLLYEFGKTTYNKNDVVATTAFCQNFIIWNIFNACDKKSYEDCLNEFDKSVNMADNAVVALHELINIMLWRYRMLLSIKELMANGCSQQAAIEKTTQMRKISFEGFGFNSVARQQIVQSGNNKGMPAAAWNAGVCNQVVTSHNGKKPVIELYSRKEMYVIVEWLESSIYWARSCKYANTAYVVADTIFAVICNSFANEELTVLRKSLNTMREVYE